MTESATGLQQIPVSAMVLTKNEEHDLPRCLDSLSRFAEVFVVDSGSTDRTREIAEQHGARVVDFVWNGRYPKKKQWSVDNLPFANPWVLILDGDESLTPELAAEIEHVAAGTDCSAFYAGLDYVFLGRLLRHGERVYKLILFERAKAMFPEFDDLEDPNVSEIEVHVQPTIDGRVGRLRGRVLHDDHDSLFEYFARQNRWSEWESLVRLTREQRARLSALPFRRRVLLRLFMAVPFKPLVFFAYSYIFKAGFLDGAAGLHYAVAKAFYYWQVGVKARSRREGR